MTALCIFLRSTLAQELRPLNPCSLSLIHSHLRIHILLANKFEISIHTMTFDPFGPLLQNVFEAAIHTVEESIPFTHILVEFPASIKIAEGANMPIA